MLALAVLLSSMWVAMPPTCLLLVLAAAAEDSSSQQLPMDLFCRWCPSLGALAAVHFHASVRECSEVIWTLPIARLHLVSNFGPPP